MKKLFLLVMLLPNLFTFGQERGSTVQYQFNVKHGSNYLSNDSIWYSISEYAHHGIYAVPSEDTIDIELIDTTAVQFYFKYRDQYYKDYCTEAFWFKDDIQTDSSQYHFDYNGSQHAAETWFETSLETIVPGIYRLEVCRPYNWKSPYFRIKEKQDEPFDTTILANDQNDIQLYPNPVSSELNVVHGEMDLGEIYIYDAQGKLVLNQKVLPNTEITRLDLTNQSEGFYVLIVINQSKVFRKNFIIEP